MYQRSSAGFENRSTLLKTPSIVLCDQKCTEDYFNIVGRGIVTCQTLATKVSSHLLLPEKLILQHLKQYN